MKNKKIFSLMFAFLFASLFCLVNVKAYYRQEMKGGQKVCVQTKVFSAASLYTWSNSYGNENWPGVSMSKENSTAKPDGSNVFCFTLRSEEEEKYKHNMIIFNNSGQGQTKDLSYVGSDLVYVFDGSQKEGSKFVGKWYVYDNKDLVNLVNEVSGYKATDYTIASYTKFLQVFNVADSISKETYEKYDSNNKFVGNSNYVLQDIENRSENDPIYYSVYKNTYNDLLKAKNDLVSRKITISSAIGGSVNYKYEENSNTKMIITSTASEGYELSGLQVLDKNGVELKNFSQEIENSEPYIYEYNDKELTIVPSYKKKQFTISFIIGENGEIRDLDDNKVTAPVTVEYGDDKTLKVVANEGYDIEFVKVDGIEYELTNGQVEIKNVQKDVSVEVSFKLKNYTVTIDGINYTVSHGSSYEYLLSLFAKEKEGYDFIGLKNANDDKVSTDYIVTGNAVFTTEYKKKTYKISFVVGENGEIQDSSNNKITSPVTIEYDDNYTLKVIANEGYDVKEIIVDGKKYELTNGQLEIKNVQKDINVEVSFKLKEYKITVDENEYSVVHGTSYNDLLKQLSVEKVGYTFIGLEDKNGNLLSSTYVVNGNDELTAKYERKTYKISLVVGKDGKVYDLSDNEVTSPITVKFEDDYTLKVIANEGYDVKEIIVDGKKYELTNGQLEIKNVQKDIEVKVDFKLKEYKITVDGEVYSVVHGTSYEELLKQIKTTKKGYVFKGIKGSDGKMLTEDYVVNSSDKLEVVYEKDPVVEVPSTGDNIIGYIMIFAAALIALSVFFITRNKKCKN